MTKRFKTFLATWRPAGGVIRVVLVAEPDGWRAYFCTDPAASVAAILAAVADRSTLEPPFAAVKDRWGAGQQHLRRVWANVGAFHLNLWAAAVVEWWAWARSGKALKDRGASPWDDATRRPSHADRRKALRRDRLEQAFPMAGTGAGVVAKLRRLARRLLRLAT